MKTWKLTAAYLVVVSFIGGSAWSRPVDLSAPGGGLGAANSKGYLEIWSEIEDAGIDFGEGSYLPLRYKFSSDNSTGGILGPGFYMPMLEAKNVLIRESTMRAYLPCGKGLYFWKDRVDPNKFQTPDKEWTGYLKHDGGDDFIVWRDDGWTILYHDGRLTSITTDEHHVFTWDYDGNTHMATGISEDGKSLVTVEPNQQGLLDAIVINGKRYEMGYAERPLTEMLLGQPVIKQLAIALASFKYPDGKTDAFKFALTPRLVPTLTFTGPTQQQTIYTWDAATNHIATEQGPDGNWTYKVGAITSQFGLPSLSRTDAQGKTEGISVDNNVGTYKVWDTDGVTTITHVFESPGPLYQKLRSIEKTANGVTTTIFKAYYNAEGNLIRKIDENNIITSYKYDATGNQLVEKVILSTDPAVLAALAKQEKVLLERLKHYPQGSTQRMGVLNDLVVFYICKALDFNKAKALEGLMTDRDEIYNLKLFLATCDPSHTAEQRNFMLAELVKEYPDKKDYTENLVIK